MEISDKPPARSAHAAFCIAGPLTGQQQPLLMVVGGSTGFFTPPLGDVWLLDVDKGEWTKVGVLCLIVPVTYISKQTAIANLSADSAPVGRHSADN